MDRHTKRIRRVVAVEWPRTPDIPTLPTISMIKSIKLADTEGQRVSAAMTLSRASATRTYPCREQRRTLKQKFVSNSTPSMCLSATRWSHVSLSRSSLLEGWGSDMETPAVEQQALVEIDDDANSTCALDHPSISLLIQFFETLDRWEVLVQTLPGRVMGRLERILDEVRQRESLPKRQEHLRVCPASFQS
jgi:hypothetical protein